MVINQTLAETISLGVNNPECAFFVGTYMGQYITAKLFMFAILVYVALKFIERLALDPLIKYIKNKWGLFS